MKWALFSLTLKQLRDSKWLLIASAFMLLLVGWTSVYGASNVERDIRKLREIAARIEADQDVAALAGQPLLTRERIEANAAEGDDIRRLRRRLQEFREATRASEIEAAPTAQYIMIFWQLVFILPVIVWAISRGSIAVSGEIERGTFDLVLSRPISRLSYLATQWASAFVGFAILAISLLAGTYAGVLRYGVEQTPSLLLLLKPILNLAALWLCIYGIAFALSCWDLVRWRPNLIASAFVLASAVARAFAQIPQLRDYKEWLENSSIFTAYDPEDAVKTAEALGQNVAILGLIGLALIALGTVIFRMRDLPSNS